MASDSPQYPYDSRDQLEWATMITANDVILQNEVERIEKEYRAVVEANEEALKAIYRPLRQQLTKQVNANGNAMASQLEQLKLDYINNLVDTSGKLQELFPEGIDLDSLQSTGVTSDAVSETYGTDEEYDSRIESTADAGTTDSVSKPTTLDEATSQTVSTTDGSVLSSLLGNTNGGTTGTVATNVPTSAAIIDTSKPIKVCIVECDSTPVPPPPPPPPGSVATGECDGDVYEFKDCNGVLQNTFTRKENVDPTGEQTPTCWYTGIGAWPFGEGATDSPTGETRFVDIGSLQFIRHDLMAELLQSPTYDTFKDGAKIADGIVTCPEPPSTFEHPELASVGVPPDEGWKPEGTITSDLPNTNTQHLCEEFENVQPTNVHPPSFFSQIIGPDSWLGNAYDGYVNALAAVLGEEVKQPDAGKPKPNPEWLDETKPLSERTQSIKCVDYPTIGNAITSSITGLANTLSNGALEPLQRAKVYKVNYACPNALPSQPNANELLVRDFIGATDWICMTRANGNSPYWQSKVVESMYTIPDVLQTIMLWRREDKEDKKPLYDKLKKLGVKEESTADDFVKLTEALPGMADILRFLVRDVADQNVIDKFKLDGIGDSKFENKWKGELVKYAKAQGVSDELARYAYRAHWEPPSRTDLLEWYNRLRKTLDGNNRDPSGVYISSDDISAALAWVDKPPYFVEAYKATSTHVIGRIDLRRLYRTGVFGKPLGTKGFLVVMGQPQGVPIGQGQQQNVHIALQPVRQYIPKGEAEKELYERYRDAAYNERDSQYLAYYTALEWEDSAGNKQRTQALKLACEAYTTGAIDRQQFKERLKQLNIADDEAELRINICDATFKMKELKAYISSIRQLYILGEVDDLQARNLLQGAGIKIDRIADYVKKWKIERAAKAKRETYQILCQQYSYGMIDQTTFTKRMIRIGYDEEHAKRIVQTCVTGVIQRANKERNQAAKAAAKEAERQRQAALRQQEKLERNRLAAVKNQLTLRSEPNLKSWWGKGEINEQFIRLTFRIRGYDAGDIEKWINANRPEVSA